MQTTYRIVSEGDGFYTIKDVPIFETHDTRGFACNDEWMRGAIQNFEADRANGHRPAIIIGHNVKGVEKESYGFLDNFKLKGKRLYADLARIPREIKEKIVRNAYPSRSVEVLPSSKRILACALLGGTAPFFSLPQMVYENEEQSLWYRSPIMTKNVNVEQIAKDAATEAVRQYSAQQQQTQTDDEPTVFELNISDAAKFLQDNPNVDIYQHESGVYYTQGDEGEIYTLPKQIVEYGIKDIAGKAAGAVKRGAAAVGAGAKRTAGIFKDAGGVMKRSARAAARNPRGAAHAAMSSSKSAAKTIGRGVRTPAGAAIAGGAAAIGTGAYLAGKARQRRQDRYQIDENTGVVYFGGEPVGEVKMYEGYVDPNALPDPNAGGDPDLVIEEGAVGHGSGDNPALTTNPGDTNNNFHEEPTESGDDGSLYAQEVDEALQYITDVTDQNTTENYQLQQEVEQLKYANELLQISKKAEKYSQYLNGLKAKGSPVGDIKSTVDFMLSQTEEQVKQFCKVLEKQPKVELGMTTYTQDDTTDRVAEAKADYAAHRMEYSALGVTDKDLQYVDYVRSNTFTNEKRTNGNAIVG